MDELLLLFQQISSGADVKQVGDLPRSYTTSGGEWFVPFFDGVPNYLAPSGGPYLMDPVKLGAGQIWQLTQIFGGVKCGWSENYYFHVAGLSDPLIPLRQKGVAMANERRKFLSEHARLEAWRLSREDIIGDSSLHTAAEWGCGLGLRTGAAADYDRGANLILLDASTQVRGIRGYGGFSNADLSITGAPDPMREAFPTVLNEWADKLKNEFMANQQSQNQGVIVGCLPSYDRDESVNPWLDVRGWSLSPQGYLRAHLYGPIFYGDAGDRVHVSNKRTPGVRGLAGDTDVVRIETDNGDHVLTLSKRPCGPIEALGNVISWVQVRRPAYYQVTAVQFARWGERVVGRPFFGQVGRRSRKC